MSGVSTIQWTDRVWNPVVGCTKVSQGCKHCYAKTLHDQRHKAFVAGKLQGIPQYAKPFEAVQTLADRLTDPLGWRKPSRVFVNSMSDLFHEDVPFEFIRLAFGIMMVSPRHTYQILTKRPERMLAFFAWMDAHPHRWPHVYQLHAATNEHFFSIDTKAARRDALRLDREPFYGDKYTPWPLPNVWLGVSVENQAAVDERIPVLLDIPAAVRFLSCEPLLGAVDLSKYLLALRHEGRQATRGVHWVIVGGESGKGARPFSLPWARDIVRQCRAAGVAPFVKQLGAKPWCDVSGISHRGNTARMPDGFYRYLNDQHGGDWNEWPEDLRVREFPGVTP